MNAPCKDCEERKPRCHSECEKYLQFKGQRKKVAQERIKETMINTHFVDQTLKEKKKWDR